MPKLFGTSGVRGIINEEITPEKVLKLARALGSYLGNSGTVILGKDPRTSSDIIESIISSGLLASGCSIKKLGVVPTPVVGFSCRNLEVDAGIMITASHNPPQYNGVKFFDSNGMAYTPEKESKIEEIYSEQKTRNASWNEIESVETTDVARDYMIEIVNAVSVNKKFKVVIDCANGAASRITPYLLEDIGCKVITLNSQLDGTFPGHDPEPTETNLRELSKIVRSTKADLGLAHDGDGDRIAAVDEKGEFVKPDKLLALVSSYAADKFGGKIITTVDASRIIDEQVEKSGGEIVRTKVGDVSVAQEMESQEASFGGEPSGTWIFGDVHLCPDGVLGGLRILEILSKSEKTLSELISEIPDYPVKRAKVSCSNNEKENKMKKVKKEAPNTFENIVNSLDIDGLRLEFESGAWVLIRPSGTEPYIRITAEANSEDEVKSLVSKSKKILR
ncbi:MAG: phosphoglucosamine mutase [Hadesarchaea archaeon]|nr:phosphoglucosamine mutase [Hadesarchaea archaeon]